MDRQCVFLWSESILRCIHNNLYSLTGIAAWLLCWKHTLTLCGGWNHKLTHCFVLGVFFFCAFPHRSHRYLGISSQQQGNAASASSHCHAWQPWTRLRVTENAFIHSYQAGGLAEGLVSWLSGWLAGGYTGIVRSCKEDLLLHSFPDCGAEPWL